MSDDEPVRDAGFDDWLDALGDGDPYFLECEHGHGSLPPRRVCPEPGCDSTDLEERSLPETGRIESVTVVSVATPAFEADAPFALAVADFGPVSLTGQVRGIESEDAEIGTTVSLELATPGSETVDRAVAFRPR
ncbi:Zn-ribbon domain-containing OB-fold protein [Saliphagus sp. LR7]|uniref:Zn-ribbon domain-containing OB-fold protein n=1 Tax=Saliphagus sp. LR7 TaxID=2282654 RepID=UPI000DF751D6|nr:OB-fold domain-containing protein [Saliphagus sp. LR7]